MQLRSPSRAGIERRGIELTDFVEGSVPSLRCLVWGRCRGGSFQHLELDWGQFAKCSLMTSTMVRLFDPGHGRWPEVLRHLSPLLVKDIFAEVRIASPLRHLHRLC